MRLFLGIDGGGSKCDAVLMDETGTVLGWGSGGSTSYSPPEVIRDSFTDAVAGACAEHDLHDLTAATINTRDGAFDLLVDRRVYFEHLGVPEAAAARRAALTEEGLVILAGTGSFVNGRLSDDRRLQVGGLGPILGDEGSGYDIGLRALRGILRVRHSANHADLRAALLEAAGVQSQWDLVGLVYGGKMGRPQIAALCRTVVAQANLGETMALDALRQAAGELAESVEIVLNELEVCGQGLTAIGIGGVIQGAPLYWEILSGQLRCLDPTLVLTVPPVKLVVGAVFEAMLRADIPVTEELRARVVETQAAFPGAVVATRSG